MVRVLAVLAALTLLGGVLRFHAASDPSAYQSKDEQSYAMLARWLAVHHEYGNPGMTDPAHWPPGAPLLFAAAYRLQPERRGDGVWDVPSAYRVQALVGTLTIPAAFLLALLVAGPVAGLLAAAAVAAYPPLIGASGDLLSEPLGALLVTCALAASVWALRELRPGRLALAGALLGATVLTRADLALVPAVALAVVVVVAWRRAERRPALVGMRAALFMGAATLAVVLPWTIVASNVTGRFVPLSSGGASNLWVGTYLPGDGSMFGAKRALAGEVRARRPDLADRRWFQLRQADVIATVAARHPDRDPEAALAMEARRNLREYVLGDPISFAGMAVDKVRRLWGGYTVGTYRINVLKGEYWVVETKTPANHDTAADQHLTVVADEQVALTFVNPRQPGSVKITKLDDATPGNPLARAEFTLYTDNAPIGGTRGAEDTITTKTCTTGADGTCEIPNVVPGEYWVVETVTPTGHDSAADQHVTVKANEQVSVTFVNVRQLGSVKITKTDDATPPNPLAGAEFTLYEDNAPTGGTRGAEDLATNKTCTTDTDGTCTITGVLPGPYWVVETKTPANHDSAADQHVTVTANEQTSVSFVDPRHRGAILVTKTRKHAASGPGDHPQADVGFTVNGVTKTTDANGRVCFDGLLFGDYTVHEVTPAGYKGEADKTVTVDSKAACAGDPYAGETVSFSNTPLSNITVSFESQVPGGTASTINCTGLTATPADDTPSAFDDISETFKDLAPGTYTCTVVVDP